MSESIQIIGTTKVIQDTESFPSGFCKRGIVVTTQYDKYPQDILVEFVKDKGDLLDAFGVGEEVSITCNVQGREYNGKYYVSLSGWQIKRIGGVASEPEPNTCENENGEAVTIDDDNLAF